MTNRFQAGANQNEIVQAVRRDGYAIVERVIDDAGIAQLKAELEPYLKDTDVGTEDFWGHHTKRFGALIGKSEMARQMLLAPHVLGVADAILLELCARYWVNYTGVMHLGRARALRPCTAIPTCGRSTIRHHHLPWPPCGRCQISPQTMVERVWCPAATCGTTRANLSRTKSFPLKCQPARS